MSLVLLVFGNFAWKLQLEFPDCYLELKIYIIIELINKPVVFVINASTPGFLGYLSLERELKFQGNVHQFN